jgi:hypothetical protein
VGETRIVWNIKTAPPPPPPPFYPSTPHPTSPHTPYSGLRHGGCRGVVTRKFCEGGGDMYV